MNDDPAPQKRFALFVSATPDGPWHPVKDEDLAPLPLVSCVPPERDASSVYDRLPQTRTAMTHHKPFPMRFRIWTGSQMIYPDDANPREWAASPDGSAMVSGGTEAVFMLSTGKQDAAGREIFDGDTLRTPSGHDWLATTALAWLALAMVEGSVVVGNVYEGLTVAQDAA